MNEKPIIVVYVDGGLVQSIVSNAPVDAEIVVWDQDNIEVEDEDESCIPAILYGKGFRTWDDVEESGEFGYEVY